MTKKTTLLLACLALLLICALIAPAAAFSGAGSGTAGDPYQITSRAQLEEISDNLSASYILANDIDLGGSSTPWTPIGSSAAPFTGTLNGNGHVITGLYLHGYKLDSGNGYASLFLAGNGASISNLGVVDVDIHNTITGNVFSSSSGLISTTNNNITITNCYVTGNITSASVQKQNYIGGFISYTASGGQVTISNCWADIINSGASSGLPANGGGFIGSTGYTSQSTVYINNSYVMGSIATTSTISGINYGKSGGFLGGYDTAVATSPTTIINSVALQSSIANTQHVNSISGSAITTSTNNYANSAMTLTGTIAGVAGIGVTSENWTTKAWWETYPGWTFDESSPWDWNTTTNLPSLRVFYKTPHTTQLTATPPLAYLPSELQLNATITGIGLITYTWQHSTDNISYTNLSTGTTYIGTISYTTTPTSAGTHYYRLILTNENNETSTSTPVTIQRLQTYTPDTIIKQTTPDITDETTSQYKVQTQHILPDSPVKLMYLDQYLAYLAVGNAVYKIQSDTGTITPISDSTGNTIGNAYLGSTNAVITDIDNITAIYDYASGSQIPLSADSTGIIASTTYYAAIKNNSGYLNLYAATGTYINTIATSVTQIAANDQTNIIIGHAGTTTLYIWQPSESSITQTTATIPYTISDIKQIIGTNQFIVTTAYKSYIYAITESGVITPEMISSANNPLSHTQSTTSDTIIGTNTNGLYIIDNTGTTIGTYTAGSTLNDASIARLTGLWAITGGDDTQAYFLTKSSTSSWTLEQTSQINNPISHTQISTTGTYALICSGTSLYLFKNTEASATLYYLNGIVISSSGAPYGNQSITMNGETIKLDSSGKFVTFVTPGNTYTFVADTTTTQYTASNAALQTIAIQLKPNPYATAITYAAAYNSTSGNIEMTYGDTTGKTESVTWSIYDTSNKTTVYTHTGTLGTETYPISIEESYKNYQVTVTADRGDTSVKNTWTITPSGSSPINLFGLDDTGKNLIFCTVLMIFGGLFGVMHSTKGALAVTALAAWMRYMELITIPWILISIAAVIAIIASLQRGGEGKV